MFNNDEQDTNTRYNSYYKLATTGFKYFRHTAISTNLNYVSLPSATIAAYFKLPRS